MSRKIVCQNVTINDMERKFMKENENNMNYKTEIIKTVEKIEGKDRLIKILAVVQTHYYIEREKKKEKGED